MIRTAKTPWKITSGQLESIRINRSKSFLIFFGFIVVPSNPLPLQKCWSMIEISLGFSPVCWAFSSFVCLQQMQLTSNWLQNPQRTTSRCWRYPSTRWEKSLRKNPLQESKTSKVSAFACFLWGCFLRLIPSVELMEWLVTNSLKMFKQR